MPFNNFERFIAFRYIKPLRSEGLLSIISWFSFFGICIGVATLIITMSVMNGFRYELENRIIGFNGHIYICLLYTSPSPRDKRQSRMPSAA